MNLKKTSVENRNVHVSKIETEYLQKEKMESKYKGLLAHNSQLPAKRGKTYIESLIQEKILKILKKAKLFVFLLMECYHKIFKILC